MNQPVCVIDAYIPTFLLSKDLCARSMQGGAAHVPATPAFNCQCKVTGEQLDTAHEHCGQCATC